MDPQITVIVPCYNEEKSVDKTIADLKKTLATLGKTYEIIFVNDCSKDKTAEKIAKHEGVTLISHKVNRGYGSSLKTGIRNAKGQWILITDCDQTYPIEDIPKLVAGMDEGYDMVVGARTGKEVHVPLIRRPPKAVLRWLINYLSGQKIPDFNSGLRVFKKDLALRFFSLFPDRFSFTTTITMAALTNGYEVKFIPINYYKREGKSSIKPKDFINFFNLIIRLTLYFKPLSVFIPVSIFFILIGTVKLVIDFAGLNRFGLGGALAVIFGIQLILLGMIAEIIIRRTNL